MTQTREGILLNDGLPDRYLLAGVDLQIINSLCTMAGIDLFLNAVNVTIWITSKVFVPKSQ
ncbi:MAG: hypothetical protein NTV01_06450 [Bacteroidia bacterium]|nr:hypothetical protein [Bacteroidia bacterium]